MATTATCGHRIKRVMWEIEVKDFSRGMPATSFMCVCPKCYQWWKKKKDFIRGEKGKI